MKIKRKLLLYISLFFVLHGESQINIRYHMYQGQKHLNAKEYQQAISWMNKVLFYKNDHTNAFLIRGISKYYLSDYYGAKSDFSKVLEFEPYHYDAYYFKGIINAVHGNRKQALKDLNKAIELFEYNPDYFSYRGQLHLEKGDTLEAMKDYEAAISIDNEHYLAHLNMGMLKLHSKKFREAIDLCTKAISLQPENLTGYLTRGKTFYMIDSTSLAKNDLQFVLLKDSTNIEAYFILALTNHKEKDYNNAMKNYDKALSLNPYNAICYYNRGILKSELEIYEEALSDFDKVVEINVNNIYAYLNRGKIKYLLKDYRGAEHDLSIAIDLFPEFTDALTTRAAVRYELKDTAGFFHDRHLLDQLTNKQSERLSVSIDSAYIEKITEFRTDFSPIEYGAKVQVQYVSKDINLLPIFSPYLLKRTALNMFSDINTEIFEDFSVLTGPYQIGLINEEKKQPEVLYQAWKSYLDSIYAISPNKFELNLLKGIAVGWGEKYYLSDKYLGKALELSPDNYLIYFIRGNHYYEQAEAISNIIMNNQVAFLHDHKANEDPEYQSVESYYFKAVAFYKKALEFNPGFKYARYNKAYVSALMNNLSDAINDYSECIEIDNTFAPAYFNRGLLYLLIGETQKGCSDLSRAGELGIELSYNIIYKYCN